MRLLELEFLKYGCFTNRRLEFPASARLVVVHGPNEAGKTTSLRGLTDFLYGIDARTTQNFLHDNRDLRIAGRLSDARGTTASWIRRKGNKQTLETGNGQAVPAASQAELLNGVSRDLFERLFRMDHAGLVAGGLALQQGQGELASSLFHAGAGIPGIQQVLARLDDEAEELFKPRGSTGPLNQAFSKLEDCRREIRQHEFSASEWKRAMQEVAELEKRVNSLQQQSRELTQSQSQIDRLLNARELTGQRAGLRLQLQSLPEGPAVPEAVVEECATLEERVRQGRLSADHARTELESLRGQLATLKPALVWSDQRPVVESLLQDLGTYRNARRDLPDLRNKSSALRAAATDSLQRVAPALTLDQVSGHLPDGRLKRERQRLSREFIGLKSRLEQGFRDRQQRLDQAASDVESPVPPDPAALRQLLANSLRRGHPIERLEAARRRLGDAERRLAPEISRLAPWHGDPESLASLPVPLPETIASFAARQSDCESQLAALDKQARDLEAEAESVREEAEGLAATGAVPSESDLQEARAHRDRGWGLVRGQWLAEPGTSISPDDLAAFCHNNSLPEAYEQSVQQADDLADRLRREADRVAVRARLHARRESLSRRLAQVSEQRGALQAVARESSELWQAEWRPCGFKPLSPAEMRGWLSCREAALGRLLECQQAAADLEECERQVAAQSADLVAELARLGPLPPVCAAGEPLWTFAGQQAEELARGRQQHEQVVAARRERQRQLETLEGQLAEAREQLLAWSRGWNAAFPEFPVMAAESPGQLVTVAGIVEAAGEWADVLEQVAEKHRQIAADQQRIALMQASLDAFESRLTPVLERVGGNFTAVSPDVIVEELDRELNRDQANTTRRESWLQQMAHAERELQRIEQESRDSAARLREQLAEYRVENLGGLRELHRHARERERLMARLSDVEQNLLQQARGIPLESFLEEVAASDPAELDEELRRVKDLRSETDRQRDEALREFGARQRALQMQERSELVAQRAQDAQVEIAEIRRLSLEYARRKLAAALLRRHLDQFRSRAQDPLLAEAGRLFARLTLDAFVSVRPEFDDRDQPLLVGIRPGESGRAVTVDAMSDGTRDQLFLALRLASLRQQFELGVRMPVVMDDILINFDDERSRATLEVLAELGEETQVLFFTHHARLVELARVVVPVPALHVIQLERFAG